MLRRTHKLNLLATFCFLNLFNSRENLIKFISIDFNRKFPTLAFSYCLTTSFLLQIHTKCVIQRQDKELIQKTKPDFNLRICLLYD